MSDRVPNEPQQTDRVRALSDGVYAFAITLLAIDLRLPPATTSADLGRTLLGLSSHYFAFVLSFAVIGSYWTGHRRVFAHVERTDDRLVWLNLLVLLSIAFLPFSTSVVASFGDTTVGVVVYAASMVAVGLFMTALWLYVGAHPSLAAPDLDRRTFIVHTVRGLVPPAVFAASIPVAFVSPAAATYVWFVFGGAFLLFDLLTNGLAERGRAARER
jgi:uncharacterized membrane protein